MQKLSPEDIISVVQNPDILDSLHILFIGYQSDLINKTELMEYIEFLISNESTDSEEIVFLGNLLWLSDEDFVMNFKNMLLKKGYIWHSEIENNETNILKSVFLLSIKKLEYTSLDSIFEKIENIFYKMGCPQFLRPFFQDISNIYYYNHGDIDLKKDKIRNKVQTIEKLIS
ncbi:DUF2247 family protein [Listeria booriae]|uniref:DUF2247 family protein n=1 Tax=Listeria booriae TaxID=1552123 RepID=UPI002880B1DB|nr:DUF2247 family protein [Listeria booriae]MDT0111964.1 DUF2247 family protein [Listeria booriae]